MDVGVLISEGLGLISSSLVWQAIDAEGSWGYGVTVAFVSSVLRIDYGAVKV